MNEPNLIVKNTAALAAARVFEKAASVCLSFVIARQLGASALGVYSAAIVFLGVITLIGELGASNFLGREVARDSTRTAAYVLHLGVASIAVCCAAMGAAFLIVPHLGYSADLAAGIYVITLAAAPSALRSIQEAVFVAHQRVGIITCSTFVSSVLNAGISLFLLFSGYGIVSIVAVYAGAQYVLAGSYFVFLNSHIARLRWNFRIRTALRLISDVRAFAASSILGGVMARPEILVLSLFRNDAQIGFYSAALRVTDLWSVIPETYSRNVFPILSHAHVTSRDKGQNLLSNSIKYLLAASLPLMAGIFVAADPIVALLYGPGFAPAVPVLRIMAWCIPLGFLYELFWRLLAARDKQHLMLRAQVVMLVVRLGGGYLLASWLMAIGAAINVFATLLAHNLLLAYYARLDGTRLGVCRVGWRLSVAALAMAVVSAQRVGRSDLWVVVLVAAVLYAAMVLLLRGLSLEEISAFRGARQVRAEE